MTTPRDEPPRDAWLREALRHAPDADAAPPDELSAAILRQARDAVRVTPRPTASSHHPLLQLWSWLARPPVAAGFATVMVAALVGVMWWDQPLDASLPRSEPPVATVAQSPAPAPASTPTPLAAAAPARAQEEEAKTAPRTAKEAAPAAAARRDDARERASTERARASADDALRARSAATAASPAAPPESPAPVQAPVAERTAQPALADARDSAAAQRGAAAQAFSKSAPAPAPALAQRRQEAATLTPVIDQPERWTWQRSGAEQAMTPAVQRWMVELDRVARWQLADTAPPATGVAVLRLWRDGVLHATLQLGSDRAWLTPTGGAPLMAPLSPAASAALQAALIAATP